MSSAFDRSKFNGAKLSSIKSIQEDAKKNDKNFSSGSGGRVDFLEVKEGRNVFRILPPHPEDTIGSPYLAKRVAMLKCEVPIFKDEEDTGKTEIKNKNIFIATQHGGLPKDPIELYIEYARNYANEAFQDKDERQKFLSPITGFRDKKGTWNWGIIPKTTFVSYAVSNGKIGRLELWEQWVKEMDKLAISEDSDAVIEVDPFSDPNEGFPLIISKDKAVDKNGKETGKFEYSISKDEPSRAKRESWDDFFERVKITDDQLMELLKQEPLSKLYGNDVYTKRDWELAIDGLQRFDEVNKYGIFENDEFMNELNELESLVPEKKDKDDDVKEMFSEQNQLKARKENKEETSDEEEVTIPEMKLALKKFIRKEFGEEAASQMPKNDKDIKLWYELMNEGEELPIVMPEKVVEESKTISEETTNPVEESYEDEIAKLRARRNQSRN